MNIPKWSEQFRKDLMVKNYSESSIGNYVSQIKSFLSFFNGKFTEPSKINEGSIKDYLLSSECVNSQRHRHSAIKLFYKLTCHAPMKFRYIEYAKKDKKLPIVLSVDEIQRMFDVCENKKHKVIFALLYSCSLRVSELINLKWTDIDRSRMIINIVQAKGNKDRQVGLNDQLIQLLTDYWKEYKSTIYVLNGQGDLTQYSERSVGEVVKQLATKAGIKNKRIYTHLIRHTSATHMVESGTDINLIQKILGHSSVKATNVYLHISHNHISKIKSPLTQIQL